MKRRVLLLLTLLLLLWMPLLPNTIAVMATATVGRERSSARRRSHSRTRPLLPNPSIDMLPVELHARIASHLLPPLDPSKDTRSSKPTSTEDMQALGRTAKHFHRVARSLLQERNREWMQRKGWSPYEAAVQLLRQPERGKRSLQQLQSTVTSLSVLNGRLQLYRLLVLAAQTHWREAVEYLWDLAGHLIPIEVARMALDRHHFDRQLAVLRGRIADAIDVIPDAQSVTPFTLSFSESLLVDWEYPDGHRHRMFSQRRLRTLLQEAINEGSFAAVRALIEAGSLHDPIQVLMDSVENSATVETVRFLLDRLPAGSRVELIRNDWEETLLHMAVRACREETIEFFSQTYPQLLSTMDEDERTPLMLAAENEDVFVMAVLLDAGANVNDGSLSIAATHGDMSSFQLLRTYGAQVNHRDTDGTTALLAATTHGRIELVRILVQVPHNADVNICDLEGETPLHAAALSDQVDMMVILVGAGALLNVQNHVGQTPLMMAAEQGNVEAVRWLLGQGADKRLQDNQGRTALDLASDMELHQLLQ